MYRYSCFSFIYFECTKINLSLRSRHSQSILSLGLFRSICVYIFIMNFTQCIDISSFPFGFFISAFWLLLINSSNHLLAPTQNLAYKSFCSFVERLFLYIFSTRLIDRLASNRFSFSFRVFFFFSTNFHTVDFG